MRKTAVRKRTKCKYGVGVSLKLILDWYDAWLREGEFAKVAAALELDQHALRRRFAKSPELQAAKELAESRRGHRETFTGYVFNRLSPEAREVWKKIQFWDGKASAYEKVEAILKGQTMQLRQELFIHALMVTNFNLSRACAMVGMSRRNLEDWRRDPAFRTLIEEIQWHKKNYFEHALIDLVEQRHPGAVVFVNKTVNADRGYSEKIQVEHTTSTGGGFSLDQLNLPLEIRVQILEALRKQKEQAPPIELEQPEPTTLLAEAV